MLSVFAQPRCRNTSPPDTNGLWVGVRSSSRGDAFRWSDERVVESRFWRGNSNTTQESANYAALWNNGNLWHLNTHTEATTGFGVLCQQYKNRSE